MSWESKYSWVPELKQTITEAHRKMRTNISVAESSDILKNLIIMSPYHWQLLVNTQSGQLHIFAGVKLQNKDHLALEL